MRYVRAQDTLKADAAAAGYSWHVSLPDSASAQWLCGLPGVYSHQAGAWGRGQGAWARPGVGLLFSLLPGSDTQDYFQAQRKIIEKWLRALYGDSDNTLGSWLDLMAEAHRLDALKDPEGALARALREVGATTEEADLLTQCASLSGRRKLSDAWRKAWNRRVER